MFEKKKIKFLKERLWNHLCKNICIALMCILPRIKEHEDDFKLLEFQFTLDKKFKPWLINIEGQPKPTK
jgi:hypothetical protein